MNELTMTIKKEWFQKIISGEKKIEYRICKPYWDVRLAKPIKTIKFRNGYKRDSPTFSVDVIKIEKINGLKTDLKIDKMVYAIYLK